MEPAPETAAGPSIGEGDREQRKSLLNKQISDCRRCEGLNIAHRTASAPGYGSLRSPVAMVGQSLCEKCMETQIPFTGGSGELIDDCFERAGVNKAAVFISNVVHCHPPGNRKSHDHEIVNCSPYLHRELEIVRPKLVIGLGLDAKRVLSFFYPTARILLPPFTNTNSSAPRSAPYLFFAKHPSWIKRKHEAALEEEYVSNLAAAVTWGLGHDQSDAPSPDSSD